MKSQSRKGSSVLTVIVALILLIFYVIQGSGKSSTPPAPTLQPSPNNTTAIVPPPSNNATPAIGQRTKTSNCISGNPLPDPACTPGAIFPDVTTDQICQSGYSSKVRSVPDSVKNAVYAEYGITSHTTGQYEVDHFISLELGGSNDIANLWPEPAEPRPGFHEKDKVENYLHAQVCSGKISLQDAQYQISTNWLAVYQSLP